MVSLATVRTTWRISDICVTVRGNLDRVTNLDVFGPKLAAELTKFAVALQSAAVLNPEQASG